MLVLVIRLQLLAVLILALAVVLAYSQETIIKQCSSSIVGSGDTVVTQSGDTVVIFTDAGEQTYNLASPSVIPLGGICSGTVLTGKTAFELFEELLVPEFWHNNCPK